MKNYSDLTFTDDFLFCKILSTDKDLCKELLELILGISIERIEVSEAQEAVDIKCDSKGIRLDIYAVDELGNIYDIEMQTTSKKDIPKRTRYYQGMIDMNLIRKGGKVKDLKKTYVIFICPFDPFKKGLPVYTFRNTCMEDPSIFLGDEAEKVVINASGDRTNLSDDMRAFLEFIKNGTSSSELTGKLREAVDDAKEHKEWEVSYMTLFMKIQEEREEAAIDQMIETGLKYGASETSILEDLMNKFHLSREDALEKVHEFNLQPA